MLRIPSARYSASSAHARVVVGQVAAVGAPAGAERRSAGQPLPAVAVKRADAGERIAGEIVGNAEVADLRVDEPVQRPPVDQQPGADAGAHRQVAEAARHRGPRPSAARPARPR